MHARRLRVHIAVSLPAARQATSPSTQWLACARSDAGSALSVPCCYSQTLAFAGNAVQSSQGAWSCASACVPLREAALEATRRPGVHELVLSCIA